MSVIYCPLFFRVIDNKEVANFCSFLNEKIQAKLGQEIGKK